MTYTVSFLSQKGGVGKSSLARTIATQLARSRKSVMLADLDEQQTTAVRWAARRELQPAVPATAARSVREAELFGKGRDYLVIDGRPHANTQAVEAARMSNLVVIPTSNSIDDLEPAVELAHALADEQIPEQRIVFALTMISTEAEARAARDYLDSTDYRTLPGHLLYKSSWRRNAEDGTAMTETRFASVNDSAKAFFKALIKELNKNPSQSAEFLNDHHVKELSALNKELNK